MPICVNCKQCRFDNTNNANTHMKNSESYLNRSIFTNTDIASYLRQISHVDRWQIAAYGDQHLQRQLRYQHLAIFTDWFIRCAMWAQCHLNLRLLDQELCIVKHVAIYSCSTTPPSRIKCAMPAYIHNSASLFSFFFSLLVCWVCKDFISPPINLTNCSDELVLPAYDNHPESRHRMSSAPWDKDKTLCSVVRYLWLRKRVWLWERKFAGKMPLTSKFDKSWEFYWGMIGCKLRWLAVHLTRQCGAVRLWYSCSVVHVLLGKSICLARAVYNLNDHR